jgi:hypothetical protein
MASTPHSPDHELKVTGFVHRQAMPRIVSDPPVRWRNLSSVEKAIVVLGFGTLGWAVVFYAVTA